MTAKSSRYKDAEWSLIPRRYSQLREEVGRGSAVFGKFGSRAGKRISTLCPDPHESRNSAFLICPHHDLACAR
jgi:hypothetical protein